MAIPMLSRVGSLMGILDIDSDTPMPSTLAPSADYCRFCYRNSAVTVPNIIMDEMIDKWVKSMVELGIMPEQKARKITLRYHPHLKRWQAQ